MHKKRGMSAVWNRLLTIIVGLVVILSVGNILFGGKLFKNTQDTMKDLWNYTVLGQKDFVPYERGEKGELTSEEEIVDNSIMALKFAIEAVANPSEEMPDNILNCNEVQSEDKVCCQTDEWGMVGQTAPMRSYDEVPKGQCRGTVVAASRCLRGLMPLCVECETDNRDNKMCTVRSFELPQSFGEEGIISKVADADDWITGAGDPLYTLYYEAFPEGEDAFWHMDASSFLLDVVFYGAVLNVIPAVGPIVGRGIKKGVGFVVKTYTKEITEMGVRTGFREASKEIGQAFGKELSERALSEFAMIFGRKTYNTLLKSDLLFTNLLRGGVKTEVAEEIREEVAQRLAWYAKRGRTFDDDALTGLLRDIDNAFLNDLDDVAKGIVRREIDDVVKTPLTEALQKSLQNQQKIKQFFLKNLLEETSEGGLRLNKEVMEKLLSRRGSASFNKLPQEAKEAYLKRSISYMDDLMRAGDDGIYDIDWVKILGRNADDTATLAIKGQFEQFYRQSYDKLLHGDRDTLVRFFTGIEPGSFKILKNPNDVYNLLKEVSPIQIRWGKIPIAGIPYRPKLMRSVLASAGTTASDVAGILNWMQRNRVIRYLVAYQLAGELAEADSMNEKFKGQGENSLVLWQPFYFERSKKYQLDAENHYINLIKERGDNARFFLASPCKTDLIVTNTQISCELERGAYLLKTPNHVEYGQPFNPGSIELELSSKTYDFDKLTLEQKRIEMESNFEDIRKFEDFFNIFLRGDEERVDLFLEEMAKFVDEARQKRETPEWEQHNVDYGELKRDFYLSLHVPTYGGNFDKYLNQQIDNTEFKRILLEGINLQFYGLFTGNTRAQLHALGYMYDMYKRQGKFNELFKENGIMWNVARERYFNYYQIPEENVDTTNIIKLCEEGDITEWTEGLLERDTKRRITIPTIVVRPEMNLYGNYNDGINYCFSGAHIGTEIAKWAAAGVAVAIDLGVGMTGVGLFAEAGVVMITGAGSAYAARKLDHNNRWPNH